jgi:hypothetical protein
MKIKIKHSNSTINFLNMDAKLHAILTSVLLGGEWSALHSSPFYLWWKGNQYELDRMLEGLHNQAGCDPFQKPNPNLQTQRQ